LDGSQRRERVHRCSCSCNSWPRMCLHACMHPLHVPFKHRPVLHCPLRNLLEPIKAKFPWITYADLYTLAGVTAIEAMGGALGDGEGKGESCGRICCAGRGQSYICFAATAIHRLEQQATGCFENLPCLSQAHRTPSLHTTPFLPPKAPPSRGLPDAATHPTAPRALLTAACPTRVWALPTSARFLGAWASTTGGRGGARAATWPRRPMATKG
jgi:hypothetical protein